MSGVNVPVARFQRFQASFLCGLITSDHLDAQAKLRDCIAVIQVNDRLFQIYPP